MRRAGDSGAAMTEAVIALPVLLVAMATCWYVHRLGRARLAAQQAAAAAAWTAAQAPGCRAGGAASDTEDALSAEDVRGAHGGATHDLHAVLRDMDISGAGGLFRLRRADTRGRAEVALPAIPGVRRGGRGTVEARAAMTCNEEGAGSLSGAAIDGAAGLLRRVLGEVF